jgi:hypothetical protein
MKLAIFLTVIGLAVASSTNAFAHCDGLDGPVVKAAQKAIEANDVNLMLMWVQKDDEAEIRTAFERTLAVRKLNAEAGDLADRFFFETLVRVHRAGEGAPYTGLKPAGRDLGPAIPAADTALRDKVVEPLVKLLTETISGQVRAHFNEAMKKSTFAKNDVQAGREFVEAYVKYIHCVEGLYQQAMKDVHGHFDDDHASGKNHHEP